MSVRACVYFLTGKVVIEGVKEASVGLIIGLRERERERESCSYPISTAAEQKCDGRPSIDSHKTLLFVSRRHWTGLGSLSMYRSKQMGRAEWNTAVRLLVIVMCACMCVRVCVFTCMGWRGLKGHVITPDFYVKQFMCLIVLSRHHTHRCMAPFDENVTVWIREQWFAFNKAAVPSLSEVMKTRGTGDNKP